MEGSNDLNEDLAIPIRKNTVTYDELRQKNRDEYAKAYHQPASVPYYQQAHQPSSPPANLTGPLNPPAGLYNPTPDNDRRRANYRAKGEDDANGHGGPKNKYGNLFRLKFARTIRKLISITSFQVIFGRNEILRCFAVSLAC